jgi:hypothetical protein
MIRTIEQSPETFNRISAVEKNFKLYKKQSSPFGDIVILKNHITLQEIFMKEKRFKCFETFKNNISRA